MMWFFRHFWIFISYHIFLLNQVEGAIAIPPSNSAPLPLFCPSVCPSVCPSIGLLTTFSGFCTFADKSLGRNGIELEMQMFPDDLPLANIDADGYCCHYASSFRRRRHYVFGLSVRPSVRPKPEIPSFDLYMGPLVHPTNRNRFTACPSVRLSVRPSVRRGFRAFAGECMEGMAWNFTCWCILTIFRTD